MGTGTSGEIRGEHTKVGTTQVVGERIPVEELRRWDTMWANQLTRYKKAKAKEKERACSVIIVKVLATLPEIARRREKEKV